MAQAVSIATATPNPMADPTSPYFLHPSESPGLLLVASVLTKIQLSYVEQGYDRSIGCKE